SSTKTFATASPQNPSDLGVFACDNAAGYYQLNGLGDGTLFWYRAVSESLPFQIGNKTFTDKQPIGNSFFVGLNDFRGYFGAKNKKVYSGGNYSNNFGPKPIISVAAPMVLDSALLYISQSGKLTFTVETPNGAVLSSKTINVERTKTTTDVETAANLVADDLNDPGRMYKIGLEFPAAGTYYIGIDFADGATIFRSNVGVNNIPITLGPDLIKLTGAFSDSNGTIVNAYYYFYNMLFKSLGCASPNRVAVEVGKPMITQSGTILTASFADNYQWYFNKVLIAGATAKTYNATASGIYQVEAISSSGCTTKSAEFNYVLSGVSPANPQEIDLKIFPVPAAELLNVSFDIPKKENIEISLSNIFGQSVFQRNWVGIFGKFATTINVKDYSPGSYILTITVGKKVYSQKITIAH
ncbi:MAG TPA: T9SS type A sorting domain-containing protein, partial [Pelobium sp.]